MKLRSVLFVTILFLVFFIFSCKDEIVISKFCTEEPELPYTEVKVKLITDVTSEKMVTVTKTGLIYAENFLIERNSVRKSANIGGYICKDSKFFIDIVYNDTANSSKLKIEGGPIAANFIPGKLMYCSNGNGQCSFTQIGSINGSYAGNTGRGSFFSPLFTGEFEFQYVVK